MTEGGRHARTPDEDSPAVQARSELGDEEREGAWPFDPELVRLVQFINAVDSAEIGLTLHVKGCMVSGVLISVAQYYRMLVEEFADLNRSGPRSDPEVAASVAKFYRPALEKVERGLEDSRARNELPELPRHIHFRHAQTIVSGQGPVTRSLWRGRLAEVDGWSFGSFGGVPPLGGGLSL